MVPTFEVRHSYPSCLTEDRIRWMIDPSLIPHLDAWKTDFACAGGRCSDWRMEANSMRLCMLRCHLIWNHCQLSPSEFPRLPEHGSSAQAQRTRMKAIIPVR